MLLASFCSMLSLRLRDDSWRSFHVFSVFVAESFKEHLFFVTDLCVDYRDYGEVRQEQEQIGGDEGEGDYESECFQVNRVPNIEVWSTRDELFAFSLLERLRF
jgi:hypothetical protein